MLVSKHTITSSYLLSTFLQWQKMCPKPPQTKHFPFCITISLFLSLLLSYASCYLHFIFALLSSLNFYFFPSYLSSSSLLFYSHFSSLLFTTPLLVFVISILFYCFLSPALIISLLLLLSYLWSILLYLLD